MGGCLADAVEALQPLVRKWMNIGATCRQNGFIIMSVNSVGGKMNSNGFEALMKPRAFVISDTAHGGGDARRALQACNCEILDQIDLAAAPAALQAGPLPDLLVLALSSEVSVQPAGPIDRVSSLATALHCPLVLSAPLTVMDTLSADVWNGSQSLLADPTDVDFAAAIAVAIGGPRHQLQDVSRDIESARLQRLADEVGRIARTLASLSVAGPIGSGSVGDMRPTFYGEPAMLDVEPSAAEVRAVIRMRRLRDRFFDRDLFADPAWDMLLDLMAARAERVQVAVSSLCIAACVPPTTALRWIKSMTDCGLFDRISDPDDGRRIFIRLSEAAAANMVRYFSALRAANELAI